MVSGRAYDATGLPTLSSSWGTVSNASWLPGVNMPVTDTTQIASGLDQGGYQASANVTSCTSADGTLNYSYDADGQLIGVATNGTTTATYNWDANGNPSNFDANGNPAGTSYVIANDNELLYDGTYRYAYDGEDTAFCGSTTRAILIRFLRVRTATRTLRCTNGTPAAG